MTKRKSTGPKTAKGKSISSRNALIHGATARTFLDQEENHRYQSLVDALRKRYPSDDPLAGLAIEKVARLTVFLRRIDDTIDAISYLGRLEPLQSLSADIVKKLQPRSSGTTLLDLADALSNRAPSIINLMRGLMARELIDADPSESWAPENYLYTYPNFCRYLVLQAEARGMTIEEVIDQIITSGEVPDDDSVQEILADTSQSTATAATKQRSRVASILATRPEKLRQAIVHCRQSFSSTAISLQDGIDAEVRIARRVAAIPDPEQMDRLMRYRTNISRQLSIATGELLALTTKRSVA